jgi:hypothetical protein
MNERDLEPEHAAPRRRIDQLRACCREISECRTDVVHLVGDVVHPRTALREEPPDRRVVTERGDELDATLPDAHRRGLDTLLVDALAVLEATTQQALVRRDGGVEIRDRDADVMDSPCLHRNDVTVAPVARRLLIGVLALTAFAGGCGGGSKSNGEAGKTAEQVVTDAQAAAVAARGVHVAGAITSSGVPLTLDLTLVKDAGATGSMSQAALKFEIIRVGDDVYVKGSDAFLRKFAGAAGAQLLHGKWLKGSASSGSLAALAPLTDIAKLFTGALGSHGKLKNEGEQDYKGQKVVAIKDTSNGGTLYVAATGTAYPVGLSGGKDPGSITFDGWGDTVSIEAPQGALDIGKLPGG